MRKRVISSVLYLTILVTVSFSTVDMGISQASTEILTKPDRVAAPPQQNFPSTPVNEISWSMAGANPQRTSWLPDAVNPEASSTFGVEWFRPIEAYIGQHVQLITARDKVYIATARGLYALDTATGDTVWRFDTELPLGHSPTVVDRVLYVGGFDNRVYALDADTGTLIWVFADAKGGFSTNPLVVEGKVLLGSRDGYFYALDQSTGHLLWQYPASGANPLGPILYSAAYQNGHVFFAANDNYAYALDVNDGALIWRSEKMPGDGYQAWWPVIYDNYVIFSSALAYSDDANPGINSVVDVVDTSDPYYDQMHQFQYSADFVKTLQRDDLFYQGEVDGTKIGPEFEAGGADDFAGIVWQWANGKTVTDGSKATMYLEDDGQTLVNRATNKPWRRGIIVLHSADGTEYTFDSDADTYPEYAPFLSVGTKSGNRYPPLIIPTQNAQGDLDDVFYAQNFYETYNGWGISRSKLAAWQFGTPYLHFPANAGDFAIDEPYANSAAGPIVYESLCCDRGGSWYNLETGSQGTLWDFNATLESIKKPWAEITPWQFAQTPGYDQMWWEASLWAHWPRLWGNYGTMNGIYHNHGLQNPIIPYKDRLFIHRSNAVIALGPNPTPLRLMEQDEPPETYEENIRQEYPQVSKPLLTVNSPDYTISTTLNLADITASLDDQIRKILQTGHLRPGYYNGTRTHLEFANYFENPGETLYTLVQAYPYVSENLKPDLEKYIKQHYTLYFETDMMALTGYWIENPNPYDLDDPNGFGQLQPREWMPLPPEVTLDMQAHQATVWPNVNWPWEYPQHNFYAMWKYAETFYADDIAHLEAIYESAKGQLETTLPEATLLAQKPWLHNAYITGYIGFLGLQDLAGKAQADAALRSPVETALNQLLYSRATDFSKDHPWVGDVDAYWRSFNVARNFMYLVPELADYLRASAWLTVQEAIDEYDWIAPYWVATRYEASFGEFSSDNLYTHSAMFQAKAYLSYEPTDQLLKYLDVPAFAQGDLFYIQNLVLILQQPNYKICLPIMIKD